MHSAYSTGRLHADSPSACVDSPTILMLTKKLDTPPTHTKLCPVKRLTGHISDDRATIWRLHRPEIVVEKHLGARAYFFYRWVHFRFGEQLKLYLFLELG